MNIVKDIYKKVFYRDTTPIIKNEQEEDAIRVERVKKAQNGICPDCGGNLYYGPEASISVNVACGECLKLFCLSPFSVDEVGTVTPEQIKAR